MTEKEKPAVHEACRFCGLTHDPLTSCAMARAVQAIVSVSLYDAIKAHAAQLGK